MAIKMHPIPHPQRLLYCGKRQQWRRNNNPRWLCQCVEQTGICSTQYNRVGGGWWTRIKRGFEWEHNSPCIPFLGQCQWESGNVLSLHRVFGDALVGLLVPFLLLRICRQQRGIIGGGFRSSGSTLPLEVNDGRVRRCRCSDEEPFSAPSSHSTVLFVTVPNTLLLLLLLHGGNMSCLPQVVRRLLLLACFPLIVAYVVTIWGVPVSGEGWESMSREKEIQMCLCHSSIHPNPNLMAW